MVRRHEMVRLFCVPHKQSAMPFTTGLVSSERPDAKVITKLDIRISSKARSTSERLFDAVRKLSHSTTLW